MEKWWARQDSNLGPRDYEYPFLIEEGARALFRGGLCTYISKNYGGGLGRTVNQISESSGRNRIWNTCNHRRVSMLVDAEVKAMEGAFP